MVDDMAASVMEGFNVSTMHQSSPIQATIANVQTGLISHVLESVTLLRMCLTLFAVAVVYDQSELPSHRRARRTC